MNKDTVTQKLNGPDSQHKTMQIAGDQLVDYIDAQTVDTLIIITLSKESTLETVFVGDEEHIDNMLRQARDHLAEQSKELRVHNAH